MKKKKKKNMSKYFILKNKIEQFKSNIPIYNINGNKSLNNDSFCNMKQNNIEFPDTNKYNFELDELEDNNLSCKKVIILPNEEQKIKLLNMFEAYRIIFNKTLKFIKTRYFNSINNKINLPSNLTKKEKIDFIRNNNNYIFYSSRDIRTYFLKDEISRISNIYNADIHSLNMAVKQACTCYKSCLTNFKNGNINKFRIRYWKQNKKAAILGIEKSAFNKSTFFISRLGSLMINKSNFSYNKINCDCSIIYKNNKFVLIIPMMNRKILNTNNNYISIDPGIRTFLTGKTDKNIIEIGTNLRDNIEEIHRKIDYFSNFKGTNKKYKIPIRKIKKRYIKSARESLKNKIDNMHWKQINYLTNNYKNILIGKWSTKSIINNETSVLKRMDKRVASSLSYYKFIERLKYKCSIKNVNIKLVDEYYTSKTCSNCSIINNKLKGSKIFKCKCGLNIDRDYNACRNILILSIKDIE
jgi:transposase